MVELSPVPRLSPDSQAVTRLSNRQKVAVLLAQLGTHRAAPILKEMTDEEAIGFTKEMVGLPPLSNETVMEVLAEFLDRISRSDLVSQGGLDLAREFLQERLGQTRAQEIIDQIEGQQASSPLSGLLRVDPQQALAVLGEQQPQVVAVLLAYLPPEEAASLLERARSRLPGQGRQADRQAHPGRSCCHPPGHRALSKGSCATLAEPGHHHPHRRDDGHGRDPEPLRSRNSSNRC